VHQPPFGRTILVEVSDGECFRKKSGFRVELVVVHKIMCLLGRRRAGRRAVINTEVSTLAITFLGGQVGGWGLFATHYRCLCGWYSAGLAPRGRSA